MSSEVVLVHGLWFRGWAMERMARQISKAGFRVRIFSYPTTRQNLEHQAEALYSFACDSGNCLPNFVAHSMGGLITLHMLANHSESACGRIVLMGSPLKGSKVARQVSKWPAGHSLLGEAEPTLVKGIQKWPPNREIGMIAGTRALGLGVLAGGRSGHGDGTVLAEESHHEELQDRIEIPSAHTSMLFSAVAADQAIRFLQKGHFSH